MAYVKTVWQNKDVISSQRLNKIEDGIANMKNVLLVNVSVEDDENGTTYTLNKTWKEIKDADYAIAYVTFTNEKIVLPLFHVEQNQNIYLVEFFVTNSSNEKRALIFETDNENGYPSFFEEAAHH